MSEDTVPKIPAADRAVHSPSGGVVAHVDVVLAELPSLSLPESKQADMAADAFVGGYVRTVGADAAFEALSSVSQAAGETGWEDVVTRKEGLRAAARALDASPAGKLALGRLGYRLGKDEAGRVVMTSRDQLTAYLSVKTEVESGVDTGGIPWKQIIASEINDQLSTPHRKAAWNATDNLGSEVDGVRQNQQSWERAAKIAEQSGVDVGLIGRSVEYIQHHPDDTIEESLGEVAIQGTDGDYDHLFD